MISAEEAVEIAKAHLTGHWMSWMSEWVGNLNFNVLAGIPSNFHGYGDFPRRDIWYVICSVPFRPSGLICASIVMILDQATGKVWYFGSANDEG